MYQSGVEYGNLHNLKGDYSFVMEAPLGSLQFNAIGNLFAGVLQERMRISSGPGGPLGLSDVTKVTISYGNTFAPLTSPVAMLSLGQNNTGLGDRTWMDVGMHLDNKSDQMYVGMKDEGPDKGTGVICWSDNATPVFGPDLLKFIFTASLAPASGNAGLYDGLEVARMTPQGHMGIGVGWDPVAIQPKRRLDIIDNAASGGVGSTNPTRTAGPQLRLTQTADPTVGGGNWTDFETNRFGDLRINPSGLKTGINMGPGLDPAKTLEIDADPSVNNNYSSPGLSGLRFNDMSDGSTQSSNPKHVVLSVNSTGDVILVPDIGGGNLSACLGMPVNYITKATASTIICNSGIWENPGADRRVAIGHVAFPNPLAQLQIDNDYILSGVGDALRLSSTGTALAAGMRLSVSSSDPSGIIGTVVGTSTSATGINLDVSGSNYNTGAVMTCTAPALAINNFGFNANNMNGGRNCYGYNAKVNNALTIAGAQNMGYYADITDNSAGTATSSNFGFRTDMGTTTAASNNYGFYSEMGSGSHLSSGSSCGLFAQSFNANSNSGVFAQVWTNPGYVTTLSQIGVEGLAGGDGSNNDVYGVKGSATGAGSSISAYGGYFIATIGHSINYGVYASGGTVCTGVVWPGVSTCTSAAGYFNGAVFTSSNYYMASDSALKTNINNVTGATALIDQLHPKTYYYDAANHSSINFADSLQYGLLAQDVHSVFPQFVKNFSQPAIRDSAGNIIHAQDDFYGITYMPFITLLIAGFKEEKNRVDSLNTRLSNLEAIVQSCCSSNFGNNPERKAENNTVKVKLNNPDNNILYQNEPNPYTNSTRIRFFISDNSGNIKITFQDNMGKTLKEVPVTEKGQGTIEVDGTDLSGGIYTYSLVIDGKVIESKKMMKIK